MPAVVLAAAATLVSASGAIAQGWSWPWSQQPSAPPPVPSAPVYRPQPGQPPPPQGQPQPYSSGQRSAICLQLEQRLAQETNRGTQTRDQLPRIENEMRQLDRQIRQLDGQLENGCYEYWLFSKSLRRTRQCVDLAGQLDAAKRRFGELDTQRQQFSASGTRSYQDEIIRELARNNCGASYQQHAARSNPFSSIWQDEESAGGGGGNFGNLPFATYRTLCVRLCDGYYFPISFSTLPNSFERDDEVCKSRCAAPVELYYHQNPGGAVEQMVSHKTRQPYTTLKTAFRYRKEFVQGCSCKQAEYVPSVGTPDRRADAQGGQPRQ